MWEQEHGDWGEWGTGHRWGPLRLLMILFKMVRNSLTLISMS